MTLVRIVKDWDWPDLMRQTPGHKGVWDGIQFTTDPVEECDFLLMLNNRMKTDINVRCQKDHIWAIMQEPYVKGFNDWMVEGHGFFSRVFTHHVPGQEGKYVVSQPAIPWHINRSFDELISCSVPDKPKKLSWIVGHARDLPGHMKRLAFLRLLQADRSLDIDLFGRAIHYIEDKWDGLAPYRYSLAVENSSSPDYWTEKIGDCFLTWTVPLYWGCTNLERYFPPDAFIRIDISEPRKTLDFIKRVIDEDDREKRLPALEEAREKILYNYQLFPHIANIVKSEAVAKTAGSFHTIPAYRRSIKTSIHRVLYKVKRMFIELTYLTKL